MTPTQIVRDGPYEAEANPLRDGPLLVVSVLEPSMEHAVVRRCLRAALAAMDGTPEEVLVRLDGTARLVLASETGGRIARNVEVFGAPLPERIAEWHANACGTLVVASDGSTLVVEATESGSALFVSERTPRDDRLTARERDVMRCVEEGQSNTDIARELWIQPTTVRKHLENIFAKLGVHSRTAALAKLYGTRAQAADVKMRRNANGLRSGRERAYRHQRSDTARAVARGRESHEV
jgi:DNA-binding CsgD family transcriptional regulator